MSKSSHKSTLGVTVHSPGTVANLVCGFDILGLALNAPYDIMKLTLLNEPNVIIHNKDNFNLPTEPEKNVAVAVGSQRCVDEDRRIVSSRIGVVVSQGIEGFPDRRAVPG